MKPASPSVASPVPLAAWIVTPSIDYLTLTAPSRAELYALKRALSNSENVFIPRPRKGERDVITLHNPSLKQLQTVIDHTPNMQVYEAEFTLDFRPTGDAADLAELVPVFRWFADCLCPCADVPGAKRRCYEEQARRYVEVPTGPSRAMTTHVWRNGRERVTQRLYLKLKDNGLPVPFPSVRLEANIGMVACSMIGLSRAWQLATFGQDLRRVLTPLFRIGAGIKPVLKRSRAREGTRLHKQADEFNRKATEKATRLWREKGAMGAATRSLDVIPDQAAHKRIGDALERLRSQLLTLQLPKNSRVLEDLNQPQSDEFLMLDDWISMPPIGVKQYEHLTFKKKPRSARTVNKEAPLTARFAGCLQP